MDRLRLGAGARWSKERTEGSLPIAPVVRCNLVFGGLADSPDQEAVIRFSGKAPRRRAHSVVGMEAIAQVESPLPRIVIGNRRADPAGAEFFDRACSYRSGCRSHDEALGNLTLGHQAPERHQ